MPSPRRTARVAEPTSRVWSDADLDAVRIDAHRSGDAIHIDMFLVPQGQRRQGLGTAAFERFEARLPSDVRFLRLFAADTGNGRSHEFWESVGFDFTYDCEDDAPVEVAYAMVKGVNGTRTPRPVRDG